MALVSVGINFREVVEIKYYGGAIFRYAEIKQKAKGHSTNCQYKKVQLQWKM